MLFVGASLLAKASVRLNFSVAGTPLSRAGSLPQGIGVVAEIAGNKKPRICGNAVHLSGAALRSTGNRVFEIFTVLGLEGLGR
ncbi:hypothetical protein C0J26_19660 [Pseudomonas baetica]|nr:hypothetical protein C0J26_19660 [Pseudomonas baetica]